MLDLNVKSEIIPSLLIICHRDGILYTRPCHWSLPQIILNKTCFYHIQGHPPARYSWVLINPNNVSNSPSNLLEFFILADGDNSSAVHGAMGCSQKKL